MADEPLSPEDAKLLEAIEKRLAANDSPRTKRYGTLAAVLMLGGGGWFMAAPGGTGWRTMLPFSLLVAGVVYMVLAIKGAGEDETKARLGTTLEPGSGWKPVRIDDGDALEGTRRGRGVRVELRRGYRKGGESEPTTVVRLDRGLSMDLRFAIREPTLLFTMDVRDLWPLLPKLGPATTRLSLYGAPAASARAALETWRGRDFDRWYSTRAAGLSCRAVRFDGRVLEFTFEGHLSEPLLDESPALRVQVDALVDSCLPWLDSLS